MYVPVIYVADFTMLYNVYEYLNVHIFTFLSADLIMLGK